MPYNDTAQHGARDRLQTGAEQANMRLAGVCVRSHATQASASRECLIEITLKSLSSLRAFATARAAIANTRHAGPIRLEKKISAAAESARPNAPNAQNCATFADTQTHRARRESARAMEVPENFFARSRGGISARSIVSALRFRSARRRHPDRAALRFPRRGCSA